MPASYLMTWEPGPRRWRKVYQGKTHTVSCRELGAPENKEASYQLANAWWRARRAEIDALRPAHPHADTLAVLARQRAYTARYGLQDERQVLDAEIARVEGLREHEETGHTDSSIVATIQMARQFGVIVPDDLDPLVAATIFGNARVWRDRFKRDKQAGDEPSETIGGHVQTYLDNQLARHKAGDLSASEYDLIRLCLEHFRDWVGTGNNPSVLTADRWEAYWRHLLDELGSRKASLEYVKKRWRHARAFVAWLETKGIIMF